MTAMTSAKFRKNIIQTITRVREDREAVIIEHGLGSVVMMPLEEYESMNETELQMRYPANVRHLEKSLAQLDAGQGKERPINWEA
jgi:antitoxin YefM